MTIEDKRRIIERKFPNWENLPDGGRRYLLEVKGKHGWKARYVNKVDAMEVDLSSLVSTAEDMLREADFEDKNFELIREILANIGLADVREFGFTWDDCYGYLHRLGYDVKVELRKVI